MYNQKNTSCKEAQSISKITKEEENATNREKKLIIKKKSLETKGEIH